MKEQLEAYKEAIQTIMAADAKKREFENSLRTILGEKNDKLRSASNHRTDVSTEFNNLLGNSIKYISKRYNVADPKFHTGNPKLVYSKNGITMARRSYCNINFLKTKIIYDDQGMTIVNPDIRYYSSEYNDIDLPWKLFQPDMVEKIKDSINKISSLQEEKDPKKSQIVFTGNRSKTILVCDDNGYTITQQIPWNGRVWNWEISNSYRLMTEVAAAVINIDTETVGNIIQDVFNGLDKCIEYVQEREIINKNYIEIISGYNAPFKMLKQIKESK